MTAIFDCIVGSGSYSWKHTVAQLYSKIRQSYCNSYVFMV